MSSPIWPRYLPRGHVEAWARALRSMEQMHPAVHGKLIEAKLIEAKSGFAIGSSAARLVAAWRAASPPLSGAAIALALESAAVVYADCSGLPERGGGKRTVQRLHGRAAHQLRHQRTDP